MRLSSDTIWILAELAAAGVLLWANLRVWRGRKTLAEQKNREEMQRREEDLSRKLHNFAGDPEERGEGEKQREDQWES